MIDQTNRFLHPCPFCGCDLDAEWDRPNPKARCRTEGCKGRQLPVLNLDQADDIAAWNHRAMPQLKGWRLVPERPSFDMQRAGGKAAREYLEETGRNNTAVIYRAMLNAAPTHSATKGDDRDG